MPLLNILFFQRLVLWIYAGTTNHFLILRFLVRFSVWYKWSFIHKLWPQHIFGFTQWKQHEISMKNYLLFIFFTQFKNEAIKYFLAKSWFNCMVSKVIVHFRTIKNIQLNDIIACELIDFDEFWCVCVCVTRAPSIDIEPSTDA